MNRSRPVYLDMDQYELDRQYDQRTLVPDMPSLLSRWQAASEEAVARLGHPRHIAYGDEPWQTLDVFPAAPDPIGVHLHYHGGAWKALSSRDAWWLAEPWVKAGYHYAAVNFGLVPDISLRGQVAEAETAHDRLYPLLKADGLTAPRRLVVSGHSSGAHLAAMASLCIGERAPSVRATRVLLASGSYDLLPVSLSARNDYLKLTPEDVPALSPAHRLDAHIPPVTIIWSRNELAEFQRQGRGFHDLLRDRNPDTTAVSADVPTHFDTWNLLTPDLLHGTMDP